LFYILVLLTCVAYSDLLHAGATNHLAELFFQNCHYYR